MRTLILLLVFLFGFWRNVFSQPLGRIAFYLDSKHVSQEAKDYYNGKFIASDNNRTFSILDSLCTPNSITRPFYLLLVSRMMVKADDALAEALGAYCKTFAEQRPNQIIAFLFEGSGKKFLENWAKILAGEFKIDCEEQPVACSKAFFALALQKVKPANKRSLEQLYERVTFYCH